jgi:excisionase family DNA binding protein
VDSELLTVEEAAAKLRVSGGMIYKLFHAGELRGPQMGRSVRIVAASIAEYVERSMNKPAEEAKVKPAGRPRPLRPTAGLFLPPLL